MADIRADRQTDMDGVSDCLACCILCERYNQENCWQSANPGSTIIRRGRGYRLLRIVTVAIRARALEMKVLGYDLFLSKEKANDLGIEIIENLSDSFAWPMGVNRSESGS